MNSLTIEILDSLITKYENSKLSTTGTKNNRNIKLSVNDQPLKKYFGMDSYKYAQEIEDTISILEKKGFVEADYHDERLNYIVLKLDSVKDIYNCLNRSNPAAETEKVSAVLDSYHFDNFVEQFIDYCKDYIENKKTYPKVYFADANNLQLILDCFKAMFQLQTLTKEREFSAKYLKDSKLFETIKNRIIRIIRDFDDCDNMDNSQILSEYNIGQNSSYALIKNQLIFQLNEQLIDLNKLEFEFSLSDEMIENMVIMDSEINNVITVENLTSFYNLKADDYLVVYLAGYHNHTKQKLLKKIYSYYPSANYYHYGDIDAGGIWIYTNLKNKTGIPFKPYKMGIEELINNKKNAKKLTENDRKRLGSMLKDNLFIDFHNEIKYMLDNNIKIEQENLD